MSLEERFWARVEIPSNVVSDCWIWLGRVNENGYGRFGDVYVHRQAYALVKGSIPEGLTIDHACWNRRCVNPAHLSLATQRQQCANQQAKRQGKLTSRFVGVVRGSTGWRASIFVAGELMNLGVFDTEQAAADAYQRALASFERGEEVNARRRTRASRFPGVTLPKQLGGRFKATLSRGDQVAHLGTFATEEEAGAAFALAVKQFEEGSFVPLFRRQKTSKYRGVYFSAQAQKFIAKIGRGRDRSLHLGTFEQEGDASAAYEEALLSMAVGLPVSNVRREFVVVHSATRAPHDD